MRDARGAVVQFRRAELRRAWVGGMGCAGACPPMAHLNGTTANRRRRCDLPAPQSTVKVVSVAEVATSPLDARLKAEARAKDAAIAGLQQEVRALRRHVGLAEPEKPAAAAAEAAAPYVSPEQQRERLQREQWAELRRSGEAVDYTRLGVVRR